MTIVEDLRNDMSLREISRVSGISLSSLYYKEKERRVKRLSPLIEQDIIRTASERPTYGYRRVGCVEERWNEGQQESCEDGAEKQQSLPSLCQAQGQNKTQESVPSHWT